MRRVAQFSPADVVYAPSDAIFADSPTMGSRSGNLVRAGVTSAHALFAVEIPRCAMRPHSTAICDAKSPEDGDVRLLLALMHLVHNVGLCNTAGPSPDNSPYFDKADGRLERRVAVFCEHVLDPDHGYAKKLRYIFAVNDPSVDLACGFMALIAANQARRAEEEKAAARRGGAGRRGGGDDADEEAPPWKCHTGFYSVHDVAQLVDVQLAAAAEERGAPYAYSIDNEQRVLGLPLNDRDNPANVQVVLGFTSRYAGAGALQLRGEHVVSEITGLHSLRWPHPYDKQVAFIASKWCNPETFFALPFHSVWRGMGGRKPVPAAVRLAATTHLRKRTMWSWKEFTDLEHMQKEVQEKWQKLDRNDTRAVDALRRECEFMLGNILRSRASRLPLVVKTIAQNAEKEVLESGEVTRPDAVPSEPAGLSHFGRWLVERFTAIKRDGNIVAHLRNFFRSDLVAFAALRRDRNLLCPVVLSRGIRGSGKSKQSQEVLKRHVNAKRAGYSSAKSMYVHDRDRNTEEYFPKDGWCQSFDEMPGTLTNEKVSGGGAEREENSLYKEMLSSGVCSWEVLGSWGANTKRKSEHGTVSCYVGVLINSNRRIKFTDSMASRIRVQEFTANNTKLIRKMVGNGGDGPDAVRRQRHWHRQGRVAEYNFVWFVEYLRATGGADRSVDLTVPALLGENFFEEYERATGGRYIATARDKELYLMYCWAMCVWYETDRACAEPGGTPMRYADGRPVAFVVSEDIAVAVLTLFTSTYYKHMHSKVACAFDGLARETSASQQRRCKRQKLWIRGSQHESEQGSGMASVDGAPFGDTGDPYEHPRDATGTYDEAYAVVYGMSIPQLAYKLRGRLSVSVEQVQDALAEMRELKDDDGRPIMQVETRAAGRPTVAMSVDYLAQAQATVDRPHAKMAEVLQRVLSYPTQRNRNVVTTWTCEKQRGASSVGADLLEVLSVGPGTRKFVMSQTGSGKGGKLLSSSSNNGQTLDEFARARYERRYRLGHTEPTDRGDEAETFYPWAALSAQEGN